MLMPLHIPKLHHLILLPRQLSPPAWLLAILLDRFQYPAMQGNWIILNRAPPTRFTGIFGCSTNTSSPFINCAATDLKIFSTSFKACSTFQRKTGSIR